MGGVALLALCEPGAARPAHDEGFRKSGPSCPARKPRPTLYMMSLSTSSTLTPIFDKPSSR